MLLLGRLCELYLEARNSSRSSIPMTGPESSGQFEFERRRLWNKRLTHLDLLKPSLLRRYIVHSDADVPFDHCDQITPEKWPRDLLWDNRSRSGSSAKLIFPAASFDAIFKRICEVEGRMMVLTAPPCQWQCQDRKSLHRTFSSARHFHPLRLRLRSFHPRNHPSTTYCASHRWLFLSLFMPISSVRLCFE